jgi:ubiquitin carboxyl-terminal hydrolase 4/11/15
MEYETPTRKRYASGLGNLGNTCFMNSTLQCLSHTDPLRRYFLSGEYKGDLNRDNPLGTGGELATQFAELLEEMWTSRSSYGAVYPRNFKYALGKHAEQFLGYDQHDSQEFATYLLDALHEDTNRVTKKPYIEKPEQKEDETDVVAADLAWKLHLRREDSRVLENFMGQVKSRVQCPAEGCGRVSTTFDPFMYLSVPIPGATDRCVQVTLVPLSGKNQNFSVTLSKTSTIGTLQKKVLEQSGRRELALENTAACDVWSNSVYTFHQPEDDLDNIRQTDTTYIYELRNLTDMIREPEHTILLPKAPENRRPYYNLRYNDFDPDTWEEHSMGSFVRHASLYNKILNPKRTSFEELVEFYLKVEAFIELCHSTTEIQYACDQYENMEEEDDNDATSLDYYQQDEKEKREMAKYDNLPSLSERCQSSSVFHKVEELVDLKILEECSKLFRQRIETLMEESNTKYKEGLLIQVVMHRKPLMASPRVVSYGSTNNKVFSNPLCLRVPPNMTVYGLREELAHILSSSFKTDYLGRKPPPPPPSSSEMMDVSEVTPDESNGDSVAEEKPHADSANLSSSFDLGSPELLIMRQIPLTYERKNSHSYKHHSTIPRQLGMLETAGSGTLEGHPISLATRDDENEKQTIAEVVGPFGTVHMNWSTELCNRAFDVDEYEAAEDVQPPDEATGVRTRNAAKRTIINVSDCIEKYCQMEQLDESEMWYCSRCKEHVRAWKQFHLYRSPPILIVHLKRFQYHSTTHRRDKIDTFIDFPLTGLDLTTEFTNWTEEEKPVYDCYAVSNHYGGLGGGHYTAYALSDEGEWCHFDDSRVTTGVDPKEVVSGAAYVLYYRRRDVVLDGTDGTITPPHPAIVQDPFFQTTSDNRGVASDGDLDMGSTSSNKTCPSPMGSIDPGDAYENSDSGYDQEISSALMKEDMSGLMKEDISGLPLQ